MILITCLSHVTAKVAPINNGPATWYTAQSVRETLHSINCPIIKTGMPQWQLESHLLSICAPETPSSLFQKSHSNCHWHNRWLLKCKSPSQYPLKTLHMLRQLMDSNAAGSLRQDKPFRLPLWVIRVNEGKANSRTAWSIQLSFISAAFIVLQQ